MIYLDHNSTTPLAPEAASAMAPWQTANFGNPASQHGVGRRARQALEDARAEIGRILGAHLSGRQPDRVIFTSGGTEANNLALFGISGCFEPRVEPAEVIISPVEHPSVKAPADALRRHGWRVPTLPVSVDGVVDAAALDRLLTERTRLVSVMLANNETGVLQPVGEMAKQCRARGVSIHTDAAQMAGKLPLDFQSLGVDAMTVAAHKFHGPLGIGALIVRHELRLVPQMLGGVQQEGYRGGTEPAALTVGMHAALAAWEQKKDARIHQMTALRDRFEAQLAARCDGELVIIGKDAARLPHTSNVAFLGLDRQALVMALDLAGVACSTGSACASGSSEPSPVLIAMGCGAGVVSSAVRFSLARPRLPPTSTTPWNASHAFIHKCGRSRSLPQQLDRFNFAGDQAVLLLEVVDTQLHLQTDLDLVHQDQRLPVLRSGRGAKQVDGPRGRERGPVGRHHHLTFTRLAIQELTAIDVVRGFNLKCLPHRHPVVGDRRHLCVGSGSHRGQREEHRCRVAHHCCYLQVGVRECGSTGCVSKDSSHVEKLARAFRTDCRKLAPGLAITTATAGPESHARRNSCGHWHQVTYRRKRSGLPTATRFAALRVWKTARHSGRPGTPVNRRCPFRSGPVPALRA